MSAQIMQKPQSPGHLAQNCRERLQAHSSCSKAAASGNTGNPGPHASLDDSLYRVKTPPTFFVESIGAGLHPLAGTIFVVAITRGSQARVLVLGVLILGHHTSLAARALSGIVVPVAEACMQYDLRILVQDQAAFTHSVKGSNTVMTCILHCLLQYF